MRIDFYTDASGKIGLGGICGNAWMSQTWSPEFLNSCKPSIEFLELFAVTAAVIAWIDKFRNRRVILFCDNQSVVDRVPVPSSGHFFSSGSPVQTHIFGIFKN